MFWGLTPGQLVQGGAAGLLAIIFVFFTIAGSKGWFIPRSTLKELKDIQEARITKAEQREQVWQETAAKWQEAVGVLAENQRISLENDKTILALLTAIADRSSRSNQSGRR